MITFLTGGARSGKSRLAMTLAGRSGAPVRYIATARGDDQEMVDRIEAHRRHRPTDWIVVEEPVDLGAAVRSSQEGEVVVIDCITLWISNLMVDRDDASIIEMIGATTKAVSRRRESTIIVSNEVGSGVVPMNPVGRRFRDLQGRANQEFAGVADTAYLVVAGRTLRLESPDDVV